MKFTDGFWQLRPGVEIDYAAEAFEITAEGGTITVLDAWQRAASKDKGARWEPAEIGPVVAGLIADSPEPVKAA